MLAKKEEQLNKIIDLFEKKNFSSAKKFLDQLLISYPNDHILENIYGVILTEEKNFTDAIIRFKKSLKIDPNFVDGYYNIAILFSKMHLNNESIENFKKAINLKPNYFEAYYGIANIYSRTENFEEAGRNYRMCLEIKPDSLDVLNNIGINLRKERKFQQSIEIFDKLLKVEKNYALGHNNLGMVYYEMGNYEQALFYVSEAIKIKNDYYEAYDNLGLLYFNIGKYSQAIFFYKKAIELNANFFNAYTNLGNVYKELGDYKNSIFFHKKAIEIKKDYYDAYINLAKTYIKFRKYTEAISALKEVVVLKKDFAEAYMFLGNCYVEIGEIAIGADYLEKSLSTNSDLSSVYSVYVFNSLYVRNFSQKKYFEITNNLFKLIDKQTNYIKQPKGFHGKQKKLRIGFVSGDFKNHPIGYFIDGILPYLKKNIEIEIFAYNNSSIEDELTKRIKLNFSEWVSIYSLDDLMVINKIRDHKIDILIDLSGHTSLNRLSVFLKKPAPIQISWAGYLASTGLDKIDYIISDLYIESKIDKSQFSERIFALPNVWCHFSKPQFDLRINDKTPAQKNNYVTFGSFNNLAKINSEVLKLWSRILSSVPNSKIFLKTKQFDDENIKNNYQKKFFKNNIDINRVILEGYSDRKTLLERYNLIDIALDPFPYSGGTTNFEASWMCVPILTLTGNNFVSNCGGSINNSLGMQDWIAKDEIDYLNKAIKFSSNLKDLNLVKKKLHDQKKISKIFDSENFASELVGAFKKMSKNL